MINFVVFFIILFIIILLIEYKIHWTEKYIHQQDEDSEILDKIKSDVSKLHPSIKYIQFYSSSESYTENKTKIYICLRIDNKRYYDYNMLIYVAIHECAHALCQNYDASHKSKEFLEMFDSLLSKAKDIHIYDPSKPLPIYYCGVCMRKKCQKH